MKVRQITIITLASIAIAMVITSCGNNNSHNEHAGHNHANATTTTKSDNRNEKGELVNASGEIITGCPMHKEMIGAKGDKCPKCNYNEMIPITWSLEGIDTVRVTTLLDYNPPQN